MPATVIEKTNTTATVRPPEDIVAASAPELRGVLRELLGQGVREVVMDLSDVEMVDSSGLGLLISTFNSLRKIGGRFSVVGVSDEVLHLFQTMRLPQHFAVSARSSKP